MEHIIVRVRDKEKAQVLLQMLAALDFVSSVETIETDEVEEGVTIDEEESDFFSLAGLWQGREISLESIRQRAWPQSLP